jgi:multiple sugar transport system substrate-binding protein
MLSTFRSTRRRKAVAAVCAIALATLTLASCSKSHASKVDASQAKPKSLRMLYASAEADSAAVQALVPAFKQKFGIDLQIDSQAQPGLQTKAFAELASRSSAYDIMIVDSSWMPSLVNKLEPLDAYLSNPALNDQANTDVGDFIPKVFYDTSVYNPKNILAHSPDPTAKADPAAIKAKGFDVYNLPIQANVLVQANRTDLFDDPAQKAAYLAKYGKPLEIPKTLDEYRQVAKFFTQPDKKLYGATVMAGVGDWSTDDFKSLLAAFGGNGELVGDNLSMDFNSPAGVQALTYYRSLITDGSVPPGSTSADWNTTAESFDAGTTAMTQNYHTVALNKGVTGTIGYSLAPAGAENGPHFGTWGLAVNPYGSNKAWAYRAITWLTAATQQLSMTKDMLHPTRTSVYADVESQTSDPSLAQFYKVLGQALAVGVGRPRLSNYTEVAQAISVAVNQAASGKSDPATALASAASQVKRLISQAGIKAGQ